jgi:phytoene dehydrogenase-like protein
MSTLKVTVIGAGLGGLTAAVACRQHGLEATIPESAREILRVRLVSSEPEN